MICDVSQWLTESVTKHGRKIHKKERDNSSEIRDNFQTKILYDYIIKFVGIHHMV